MFDAATVFVRVDRRHVNFVNQIFEGYEYLGTVTTVDRAGGILAVRATPDTKEEVVTILADLPVPVEVLSLDEINFR